MLPRSTLPKIYRMEGLTALLGKRGGKAKVVFVMAAPGDAILCAGGSLHDLDDVQFLHVTDGAPRNLEAAVEAGYVDRLEYAEALERESDAALDCAGLPMGAARQLDFSSGGVANELPMLTMSLAGALRESAAEVVVTHPYNGSNSDHNGIAFAVQAACAVLESEGRTAPLRLETDLHGDGSDWKTNALSDDRFRLKQCMMERMPLRLRELKGEVFDSESFRAAPQYDFIENSADAQASPPRWRKMAADAMRVLGLVVG